MEHVQIIHQTLDGVQMVQQQIDGAQVVEQQVDEGQIEEQQLDDGQVIEQQQMLEQQLENEQMVQDQLNHSHVDSGQVVEQQLDGGQIMTQQLEGGHMQVHVVDENGQIVEQQMNGGPVHIVERQLDGTHIVKQLEDGQIIEQPLHGVQIVEQQLDGRQTVVQTITEPTETSRMGQGGEALAQSYEQSTQPELETAIHTINFDVENGTVLSTDAVLIDGLVPNHEMLVCFECMACESKFADEAEFLSHTRAAHCLVTLVDPEQAASMTNRVGLPFPIEKWKPKIDFFVRPEGDDEDEYIVERKHGNFSVKSRKRASDAATVGGTSNYVIERLQMSDIIAALKSSGKKTDNIPSVKSVELAKGKKPVPRRSAGSKGITIPKSALRGKGDTREFSQEVILVPIVGADGKNQDPVFLFKNPNAPVPGFVPAADEPIIVMQQDSKKQTSARIVAGRSGDMAQGSKPKVQMPTIGTIVSTNGGVESGGGVSISASDDIIQVPVVYSQADLASSAAGEAQKFVVHGDGESASVLTPEKNQSVKSPSKAQISMSPVKPVKVSPPFPSIKVSTLKQDVQAGRHAGIRTFTLPVSQSGSDSGGEGLSPARVSELFPGKSFTIKPEPLDIPTVVIDSPSSRTRGVKRRRPQIFEIKPVRSESGQGYSISTIEAASEELAEDAEPNIKLMKLADTVVSAAQDENADIQIQVGEKQTDDFAEAFQEEEEEEAASTDADKGSYTIGQVVIGEEGQIPITTGLESQS